MWVSFWSALIQDQLKKLTLLGLSAVYVVAEEEPAVLQDIAEGKFVCFHLAWERWRNVFECSLYQKNPVGVAVDGVECVTESGTSASNKNCMPFRLWYSLLNEVRSLVRDVPFIALTATVMQKTKERMFELLECGSPKEITKSPDKINVIFCAEARELPVGY